MLPPFRKEFTKSQINQINKAYQTGGRLVIKPTRKQIEGGFLGTLASIGIPMAISLVSKMFGGGLQVDRRGSSNISNVYVPHPPPPPPPPPTHGEGYPYHSPPFIGTWENPKKKFQRQGSTIRKKTAHSTQFPFSAPFCSGGTYGSPYTPLPLPFSAPFCN